MPVYVITGASRGLGLDWVDFLSSTEPESTVIGLVRNPETSHLLKPLTERPNVKVVKADVTNEEQIKAAAKEVGEITGGKLDVLINNAAICPDGKPIEQCTAQEYRDCFDVNTISTITVTNAFLPLLRAGTAKTILNISSFTASQTFIRSQPAEIPLSVYVVSKAAQQMYTNYLAKALEKDGFIAINLDPGYVKTDMNGDKAFLEPRQSVEGMNTVLKSLTKEKNGLSLSYDGKEMPL